MGISQKPLSHVDPYIPFMPRGVLRETMFSVIFIRRPRFAIVISLLLFLAGAICGLSLPISEYPPVSPPTIMVRATYPGASAQVIADTVAAPIEKQINGVEKMTYYSSTSNNQGDYSLNIIFETDADENMALINVNNAVKRAEHSLPNEVVSEGLTVVKRSPDIIGAITFTSTNPEHSDLYISNYVSINVVDAITRINGVGQTVIFGELPYSMRVWLDPIRMHALDIGYAEVVQAIESQNVQAATGSVGNEFSNEYMQFKVDAKGRLTTPEEFANIVIRSGDSGRLVRLGDISKVELGSEDYTGRAKKNGTPAIIVAIFKLNDANALELINNINQELAFLSRTFPEGLEYDLTYDSTKFIRVAMVEIVQTLLLTFLLVVAITYMFLQNWRATLIPALAIPVSLIGTFIFMAIFGMSINVLTMFGFILVVGSVVDDAICVVESCARLIHEEKLTPYDAAIKSMEQLSGALVATTLVVVAIYLPIAFYGGMVGAIYTQFAVTMCIALCISTLNALTLSPAICAIVMCDIGKPNVFFRAFNRIVKGTQNYYLKVGGFLARRLILTAAIFTVLLAGNYWVFHNIPSSFLPDEDKGTIFCDIILPPGASLARSDIALNQMVDIIQDIPGVEAIISAPGRSLTAGEGENLGQAIITLVDWNKRKTPETQIENIQAEIMKRCSVIPDATVTAFVPPAIAGLGATGGVSFALLATGDQTPQEMAAATNHLMAKIMESGMALYAFTSFDANMPTIQLDLDRDKAETMNVPVNAVFNTLQTQLGSYYVNDFNMYSKTYKVKLQSMLEFRDSINSISQLHVLSDTGDSVPISAIARVGWILGTRQAERFNMFQSAAIRTQSLPGVPSSELMSLIEELVATELSNEFLIGWTDMSYQETQNQGQIVWLMALALLFGYLFLVAQYESWTIPISVFLSVGTATLGGMLALKWYGQSMNIYCQLGILMLVGLTTKTAILMVEFSKQERESGLPIFDAAISGMRMRFRAVVMTGLSFIIGVAPMVMATGAGSGSRRAIGQTTFWGMIVAMAIGMVFIPALYVIFQRAAETIMGWVKKKTGVKTNRFSRRVIPKK